MSSKYVHDTFVHNTNAAGKIIPALIKLFNPKSVIDVGCGTGTWLKVIIDNGITDIKGIEGNHLDTNKLVVPRNLIQLQDLELEIQSDRKFDLAISLEVAEHLSPDNDERFVKSLVSLSDIIIFSAAIPYQGGQNHLNEQWLSHWISLFQKNGFIAHDIIRPMFWSDKEVEFWYKQNSCIFIRSGKRVDSISSLPTFYNKDLVHPDLYIKHGEYRKRMWEADISINSIFRLIGKKIKKAF